MILVLLDHDRGELSELSLEALSAARTLGDDVHAVFVGEKGLGLAGVAAAHGASTVHVAQHEAITDYGPDAWADSVTQLADTIGATTILATGTDRGNEVLAHVGARLALPMVANALEIDSSSDVWSIKRVRWGGSLHEMASLDAPVKLVTVAPHTFEAVDSGSSGVEPAVFTPELGADAAVTLIQGRAAVVEGVTLATAPVVVSGGRGVGSAEGFEPLEELAELLGGVVGCSRVVTNNGWRNHKDQVGQTGTVVAPDIYIACGISGAIQHWVGMMAAKHILAINTDPEAPMVTKANWAVIADLHEVIPAITAEVKRRRG